MTIKTKAVFCVEGTVEGEPNRVIGRCGDSAIKVNDVFDTVCQYKPRRSIDEFSRPPELTASFPVTLKVLSIRAYGRDLDELGEGMTGSLVLAGDGLKRIGSGSLLESVASTPDE